MIEIKDVEQGTKKTEKPFDWSDAVTVIAMAVASIILLGLLAGLAELLTTSMLIKATLYLGGAVVLAIFLLTSSKGQASVQRVALLSQVTIAVVFITINVFIFSNDDNAYDSAYVNKVNDIAGEDFVNSTAERYINFPVSESVAKTLNVRMYKMLLVLHEYGWEYANGQREAIPTIPEYHGNNANIKQIVSIYDEYVNKASLYNKQAGVDCMKAELDIISTALANNITNAALYTGVSHFALFTLVVYDFIVYLVIGFIGKKKETANKAVKEDAESILESSI